jgi:hypothetical protein
MGKDLSVEFHCGIFAARKATANLRGIHAEYIHQRDADPRFSPHVEFIISGLIPTETLPDLIVSARTRRRCQQVIDTTRQAVIVFSENCTKRDASIVVIARRGVTVEITDVPADTDMVGIARAILGGVGKDVAAAAKESGAKATVYRATESRTERP